MKSKLISSLTRIFAFLVFAMILAGCFISQPTFRRNKVSSIKVEEDRLKAHVIMLSRDFCPRDWLHTNNLNACAAYIANGFRLAGAGSELQIFEIEGRKFQNVIGRFGVGKGSKIIIGAHYDACGEQPGADDNASAVAALIELAHLFGQNPPEREVELVAYTLEEPPFFGTEMMGSAIHARSVFERKEEITGVIVLEMVGYFSDKKGSQSYPFAPLKLIYPSRGNFIAVAGRWDQGDWIKQVKIGMKETTPLPVYSIRAPSFLQGIDFSDHRNYWPYGINAIMVTDTAFYRNKAYHTEQDTPDQLDYARMSQVVTAVFEAVHTIQ